MAKTRLDLHRELKKLCDKCYYSPPDGFKMEYPCIVYELAGDSNNFADNERYTRFRRYTITIITSDPDSDLPDKLSSHFKYCRFDRLLISDNLNNFIYTLYY